MKSLTRCWLALVILAAALATGPVAVAQGTRDGVTPAVEDSCNDLRGAAYGLCVAFCEANDCDTNPDGEACDRLRENYEDLTGDSSFPCEGGLS